MLFNVKKIEMKWYDYLMINAQIKHKHLCVFETFIIPTTVEKTNKQTKTPDEDKNTRSWTKYTTIIYE